MNTVRTDFDVRCQEVRDFLSLLKQLEEERTQFIQMAGSVVRPAFGTTEFKVMKASVFLLIYNAVESAIRAAYEDVYGRMNAEKVTIESLTSQMRNIWISQRFRRMERSGDLSPNHFRQFIEDITARLCEQRPVDFQSAYLPISGNLNAERVRKVCHDHGVSVSMPEGAAGCSRLDEVWRRRNELSHGETPFSHCGRDFTVQQLQEIAEDTFRFINGILNNIQRYAEARAYNGTN